MDKIFDRLTDVFSWERISAYLVERLLPDLAVATILLVVYLAAWRLVREVLRAALKRSPLDATAAALIRGTRSDDVVRVARCGHSPDDGGGDARVARAGAFVVRHLGLRKHDAGS